MASAACSRMTVSESVVDSGQSCGRLCVSCVILSESIEIGSHLVAGLSASSDLVSKVVAGLSVSSDLASQVVVASSVWSENGSRLSDKLFGFLDACVFPLIARAEATANEFQLLASVGRTLGNASVTGGRQSVCIACVFRFDAAQEMAIADASVRRD
jgi:hypothetical protein